MHYEAIRDVRDAIAREKQIKAWTRAKRIALIETLNSHWRDLSENWRVKPDDNAATIRHEPTESV